MASSSNKTTGKSNEPRQEKDSIDEGESDEISRSPGISHAMQQHYSPFPFLVLPGCQAPNNVNNTAASANNLPGLSIPPSDLKPLKIPWGKKRSAVTRDLSARPPKFGKTTASAQRPKTKAATSVRQPKPKTTAASVRKPKSKKVVEKEKDDDQSTAASVQQPKPKDMAEEEKHDDQSDLVCLHPVHLKPDQIADLEHVIRVGWNCKSMDRRIREFLYLGANKTKVTRGTTTRSANVDGLHLHAEDCRLYSTRYGFENDPWPKVPGKSSRSKKAVVPDDTLWDQEHGDGIHPLAFEALRLSSQIPRTKKQKQELQRWSSSELNGVVNVKVEDVPQLLLSRAWERAVHAAASSVLSSSYQRDFQQESMSRSVALARDRCNRLGIKLLSGDKALKCPCCKLVFGSSPALETHFYGKRTTYGCAWRLIAAKERNRVKKILDTGVRSQIDTLFQFIATSVRQIREERANAQDSDDALNWQDILDILRDTIVTSQTSTHESSVDQLCNPLLDTIQINSEEPPLLMNDVLLKTIEARLHDRYANVEGKSL